MKPVQSSSTSRPGSRASSTTHRKGTSSEAKTDTMTGKKGDNVIVVNARPHAPNTLVEGGLVGVVILLLLYVVHSTVKCPELGPYASFVTLILPALLVLGIGLAAVYGADGFVDNAFPALLRENTSQGLSVLSLALLPTLLIEYLGPSAMLGRGRDNGGCSEERGAFMIADVCVLCAVVVSTLRRSPFWNLTRGIIPSLVVYIAGAVCVSLLAPTGISFATFPTSETLPVLMSYASRIGLVSLSLFVLQCVLVRSFTLAESCLLATSLSTFVSAIPATIRAALAMLSLSRRDAVMEQAQVRAFTMLSSSAVLGGGACLVVFAWAGIIDTPSMCRSAQHDNVRTAGKQYRDAGVIYLAIAAFVLGLVSALSTVLGQNAVLWAIELLTRPIALKLAISWVILLTLTMTIGQRLLLYTKQIVFRKLYHILVTAMVVPGVLLAPSFLQVSLAIALALLLVVEYLRIFRVAPLGDAIHSFIAKQIDARDSGTIVLTHLYLLLGCAVPIWVFTNTSAIPSASNTCILSPYYSTVFAGVSILGVGDAVASVIGVHYGTHRWPGARRKSFEGSLAGLVGCLILPLLVGIASPQLLTSCTMVEVTILVVSTTLTIVMEAYTTQIDNLILPAYLIAVIAALTSLT